MKNRLLTLLMSMTLCLQLCACTYGGGAAHTLPNDTEKSRITDDRADTSQSNIVPNPQRKKFYELKRKYDLSSASADFILEHNVDLDALVEEYMPETGQNAEHMIEDNLCVNLNQSIKSLINETEAYNFTDEQIEKYMTGVVSHPSEVKFNGTETSAVTLASRNRPTDKGIGYEVRTLPGYFQQTAFVTLPEVFRVTSSQYMFFSVSGVGSPWCIDVGMWYSSGEYILGWRGCYTADKKLHSTDLFSQLKAGDNLYFNVVVQSNGYLRFRVLDAQDFSNVYWDIMYNVSSHKIYQDNACINRQISLCNNTADFTEGSYCTGAHFYDVYAYNISGPVRPNDDVVEPGRCGVFGTNDDNVNQVVVNSYLPWYEENVSIFFNGTDSQT